MTRSSSITAVTTPMLPGRRWPWNACSRNTWKCRSRCSSARVSGSASNPTTRRECRRHEPNGRNNQLGVNLVVGERIWDVQSKFRLRIGPLTWQQFRSLMPNGPALRPLCQMTRLYVGPTLDFDVQPVLKPEEVPSAGSPPIPTKAPTWAGIPGCLARRLPPPPSMMQSFKSPASEPFVFLTGIFLKTRTL